MMRIVGTRTQTRDYGPCDCCGGLTYCLFCRNPFPFQSLPGTYPTPGGGASVTNGGGVNAFVPPWPDPPLACTPGDPTFAGATGWPASLVSVVTLDRAAACAIGGPASNGCTASAGSPTSPLVGFALALAGAGGSVTVRSNWDATKGFWRGHATFAFPGGDGGTGPAGNQPLWSRRGYANIAVVYCCTGQAVGGELLPVGFPRVSVRYRVVYEESQPFFGSTTGGTKNAVGTERVGGTAENPNNANSGTYEQWLQRDVCATGQLEGVNAAGADHLYDFSAEPAYMRTHVQGGSYPLGGAPPGYAGQDSLDVVTVAG